MIHLSKAWKTATTIIGTPLLCAFLSTAPVQASDISNNAAAEWVKKHITGYSFNVYRGKQGTCKVTKDLDPNNIPGNAKLGENYTVVVGADNAEHAICSVKNNDPGICNLPSQNYCRNYEMGK